MKTGTDNFPNTDDRALFPFAAIVGQSQLKTALLLCAVDPSIGGVLIRGDKGTAKSTAARALTAVLPEIQKVIGCAYNCVPGGSAACCETCRNQADIVPASRLGEVPFVTLPLGATEDRVLGTLDLQRALQEGQRAFQPGLLAAAHRGILYIDEVNLLADHLVDVLLDVAAMGVNVVQREGLSISHPARFTLIGTMNLEEGDLRPQLLDRFGLMVEVTAPRDKAVRAEVVRRRIAWEADSAAFEAHWALQQNEIRQQLVTAQQLLPTVELNDALLELISHLCCEFDVASLRADIVMHKAARAFAALAGRRQVTPEDVRHAAELVLPHRRRRKPFEQTGLDHEKLDELMQPSLSPSPPPTSSSGSKIEETTEETVREGDQPNCQDVDETASEGDIAQNKKNNVNGKEDAQDDSTTEMFSVAAETRVKQLKVVSTPQTAKQPTVSLMGHRSDAPHAARGHVIQSVADRYPSSLAVGATLRSAVLREATQESVTDSVKDADHVNRPRVRITDADLHQQVRAGKTGNLIVFVVDASGSMAAQRRMEAVKGAVLALLTDVYQHRDHVAVIAFRGERASLLLEPTHSVEQAERELRQLPTGGRTPLPHALQLALQLFQKRADRSNVLPPLLVLLSDGKANVGLEENSDPWHETLILAEQIAACGIPALVLDTETGYVRLGRAAQLAQMMGAECVTLEDISADTLSLAIRVHAAR